MSIKAHEYRSLASDKRSFSYQNVGGRGGGPGPWSGYRPGWGCVIIYVIALLIVLLIGLSRQ